jgi:hypothetical protein
MVRHQVEEDIEGTACRQSQRISAKRLSTLLHDRISGCKTPQLLQQTVLVTVLSLRRLLFGRSLRPTKPMGQGGRT